MNYLKPFAEIIQSQLDNFLAQSWDANELPSFGSIVQVEDKDLIIFGIVSSIQTGSMDPMRYPFTYKKTEEELKTEQPQIFEFLKTTFNVQIVGYAHFLSKATSLPPVLSDFHNVKIVSKDNYKIHYQLPSKPCKIHAFVKNCSQEIIKKCFINSDFLHLLFSSSISNLDELLLAILTNLKKQNLLNNNMLNCFCSDFSLLTRNDYRRLKLFLKRVQTI